MAGRGGRTGGRGCPDGGIVVADDAALRRLPGLVAIARTGLAMARGDLPGAATHARRALELAPEDDHLTRGGAAAFLGLAYWASGDLEAAHRSHAAGMESLRRDGRVADTVGGAIARADIRIAQGRLREALRTYEDALALASAQGRTVPRGTADMHVGLAELHRERGDLHVAMQHLLTSEELGEHRGFPQYPYRQRVAMARIREAEGDRDAALALLDEAERRYVGDFHPNVRPIAALKARVWAAQGRVSQALDWARERGLSAGDELTYLREYEHITLARVLLARNRGEHDQHALQEATGLLGRLLDVAEAGGRMGSAIEILILQALAHHAHGDTPAALAPIARALALAEPEGYVRTFVDEGPSMLALLDKAAKRGIAPIYVRLLLAAFGRAEGSRPIRRGPIEPLSDRERDVLRLLRGDLSGSEIARELMVSLNTLHSHTKNIYSKLGVNTRRAAVRRAEELDLF